MTKLPFLLNEKELSTWCYHYCKHINDDPKIRKYITEPLWAYCYCLYINDDPEVRKFTIYSKYSKDKYYLKYDVKKK